MVPKGGALRCDELLHVWHIRWRVHVEVLIIRQDEDDVGRLLARQRLLRLGSDAPCYVKAHAEAEEDEHRSPGWHCACAEECISRNT